MSDLQATLADVERRYQAAQEAAGAAHLAYQRTGYALAIEQKERRYAMGQYYSTDASARHELAEKALVAANAEVTRLADLRARLRTAVRTALAA
jgi:hypothetical protein